MEIDGETAETVSDFILGGSKITADGDCSHEIRRAIYKSMQVSFLPNICMCINVCILIHTHTKSPMEIKYSNIMNDIKDADAFYHILTFLSYQRMTG